MDPGKKKEVAEDIITETTGYYADKFGVPVGMDRAEKKRWIWPWGSLCLRGWASQTLGQALG